MQDMKFKKFTLRYLLSNLTLLNMLLLILVFISSKYIIFPLFKVNINPNLLLEKRLKNIQQVSLNSPTTINFPSLSDFSIIGDENLFHPERKIPIEKKEEKPLPKPDFVLYGTLVSETLNLAYLEDLKEPYSSPGRGKRQIPLRQGDTLSGFTLKEIYTDKVVMVRGEEKIVLNLTDPIRKKREVIPVTEKTQASKSSDEKAQLSTSETPSQPQQTEKSKPPASRKQIDQDVFKFFERLKNKG